MVLVVSVVSSIWEIAVMYQKVYDDVVHLFVKEFFNGIWNGDHVSGGVGSVLEF